MLSLTPPALHSLHSICSGGVSASGGALGLFRLDVCMCQQGGEFLGEVIEQGGTCLILALRVHYFGRIARVGENAFQREFLLWLWLLVFSFSLCFLHDCVELYLCL